MPRNFQGNKTAEHGKLSQPLLTKVITSAIMFTHEQNQAVFTEVVPLKKSDADAVKKCALFSGLSDCQLDEMINSGAMTVVSYKKHDVIFTPSSYTRSLAIIAKGEADVYKQTDKGLLFLSILSVGCVFGMAAMFYEDNGFINTVSARTNCRVCFLPKENLEKIFVKYPTVANNYIVILSQKIHYLNKKISNLTSPSPAVRLFSFLQSLSIDENGCTVLPMSVSELSRVLSLGRTSLYNAFDELISDGKIERCGKNIRILLPKGNE